MCKLCFNPVILLVHILILFSPACLAQLQFQKTYTYYPPGNTTIGINIDGSALLLNTNAIQGNFSITKIDSSGNFLWNKIHYLNANINFPVKLPDQNFIASGYLLDTPMALIILKFDTSGTIIWTKLYQTTSIQTHSFSSAFKTHDNGFLLGGVMMPQQPPLYYDILVIRTDSAGNLLWSKTYSDTNLTDEVHIIESFDKNILIASRRHINYGIGDGIQFIKTDSIGNIIWSNQYYGDSVSHQIPRCLLQTPDSGFLINSSCDAYDTAYYGGYNLLLLKTDKYGNMHWSKVYQSFYESYYTEIQPNHDLISSGIVTETDTLWEPLKAGILKTDIQGNIKWCRRYSSLVHGRVATRTPDNGFLLTTAVTQGNNELLVIKTDSNGISVCDENQISEHIFEPVFTVTPAPMQMNSIMLNTLDTTFAFSLAQKSTNDCLLNRIEEFIPENHIEIIPNPSSGNFIVKPPQSAKKYDLKIYNSSGILVQKHSNLVQEIYIDNKDLKPGLYFIQLSSGEDNLTEKLLIID